MSRKACRDAVTLLSCVRKIEDLARINSVRVTDLSVIGLEDRGVARPVAVNALGDGPKIVAMADDGLARGEAAGIGSPQRLGNQRLDVGRLCRCDWRRTLF